MPVATLSGRERVHRAMERRPHDRVPRHDSFWGETITRWKEEGLAGDRQTVLEMLGNDLQSLCGIWPHVFPGQETLIMEDSQTRVLRDSQGKRVRYWKDKSGTPEHLGFECDSRQVWETRFKPLLLDTGLQIDPEAARRNFRIGRSKGLWCHLTGVESFEETRSLMGDEITLMAMAEDPEWIRDVSVTFTDQVIRNLDAAMATGIQPDGLWIYGDMAFKTSTMCSPSMYRELIWPDHKRLVDWAHAHRMKFIFHTDGNINGVMDLYVQAGFDCIQPLEAKAGMDLRTLAPRYGDHLSFFGNVDIMVMGGNDRARIEQEVRAKLTAGMRNHGYIYHSDHSVPPTVSWDTYRFIIELLDRYGRYE